MVLRFLSFFVSLIFLIISISVFAKAHPDIEETIERLNFETADGIKNYYTVATPPNYNGTQKPIIFIPGMASTKESFYDLGKFKTTYPYLAWLNGHPVVKLHLRNQGNKPHNKSRLVLDNSETRFSQSDVFKRSLTMSFDASITDLHQMIKIIHKRFGSEVFLAGHSMGGMISELVASGVRVKINKETGLIEKVYEIRPARAEAWAIKHIAGIVAFGSPGNQQDGLPPKLKMGLKLSYNLYLERLLGYVAGAYPDGTKPFKPGLLANPEFQSKMLPKMSEMLEKAGENNFLNGMIGGKSFDYKNGEMVDFLTDMSGGFHMGLILNTLSWIINGYGSRDGNVDYRYRKTYVPTLFIDGLIDPALAMKLQVLLYMAQGENARVLNFAGGHSEGLNRYYREEFAPLLQEFFTNPKNNSLPNANAIVCASVFF